MWDCPAWIDTDALLQMKVCVWVNVYKWMLDMPGLYRWPNKHLSFGHFHAGWRDEPEEATHNGGLRMRAHSRKFSHTHLRTHTCHKIILTLRLLCIMHTWPQTCTTSKPIMESNCRLLTDHNDFLKCKECVTLTTKQRKKFFASSEVRVILYVCVHLGNKGLYENWWKCTLWQEFWHQSSCFFKQQTCVVTPTIIYDISDPKSCIHNQRTFHSTLGGQCGWKVESVWQTVCTREFMYVCHFFHLTFQFGWYVQWGSGLRLNCDCFICVFHRHLEGFKMH